MPAPANVAALEAAVAAARADLDQARRDATAMIKTHGELYAHHLGLGDKVPLLERAARAIASAGGRLARAERRLRAAHNPRPARGPARRIA